MWQLGDGKDLGDTGGDSGVQNPQAAAVSWNVSRGTHASNVEYHRGHTAHLHEVM